MLDNGDIYVTQCKALGRNWSVSRLNILSVSIGSIEFLGSKTREETTESVPAGNNPRSGFNLIVKRNGVVFCS